MDTTSTAQPRIYYPESDGKPMGETDVHIDVLIYLREALRDHFREAPQVYVAGNLVSQELGLELRVEEGRLRLVNPATGGRLLTPAEAQAARRAEATARQAEASARREAEARTTH
jgi:hypothetical protein